MGPKKNLGIGWYVVFQAGKTICVLTTLNTKYCLNSKFRLMQNSKIQKPVKKMV